MDNRAGKWIISACKWMKKPLCSVKRSFNWVKTEKCCKALTLRTHTRTRTHAHTLGVQEKPNCDPSIHSQTENSLNGGC